MFYFGRRLAYVACACSFALGLIGVGLFTSVPATTLMFLLTGWFVVREVRFAPVMPADTRALGLGFCAERRRQAGPAGFGGTGVTDDRFPRDWVIVAGGFHDTGAMDRANAALARHLLERGARVHLVGHDIDDRFTQHPNADCHVVPRPRAAAPLAESLLSRRGIAVASEVTAVFLMHASSSTAATAHGPTSTGCMRCTPRGRSSTMARRPGSR